MILKAAKPLIHGESKSSQLNRLLFLLKLFYS